MSLASAPKLVLYIAWSQILAAPLSHGCGDSLFSPLKAVSRDAYLLTEGESLRLSCSVCGVCVPSWMPECSETHKQAWMTPADREKSEIRAKTRVVKPKPGDKDSEKNGAGKSLSFRKLVAKVKKLTKLAKEKAYRAAKRVQKAALTAQRYMFVAVQRFDRLKRLGLESESGVGILKELWNPDLEDASLQWFVETASGETSRVKHDTLGVRLLFDMLVISRASGGNTGMYTCRWNGRVVAQFGVTVVDGGVEPYREFEPGSGRSLQPKLMSKANLEVYTRWMGRTLSLLLPAPNASANASAAVAAVAPPVNGTMAAAVNTSFSWGICYVKQLDPDRPVKPEGSPSLKVMPHGLPCRSHLLPLSVRSLRSIVMRPSEARKMRSTVLVNQSALDFGLQASNYITRSPPPLSVDAAVVKRSFMVSKQGDFVSLECPLKQTVRTLIAWFVLPNETDKVDRILLDDIRDGGFDPFDLREATRGRMFTDPGGNLNIANVSRSLDQRKYFCLHKGRLVGYVNLIIRYVKEESNMMYMTAILMNVLRVASPLVITVSIIFLTLVTASSMFEPEVPW